MIKTSDPTSAEEVREYEKKFGKAKEESKIEIMENKIKLLEMEQTLTANLIKTIADEVVKMKHQLEGVQSEKVNGD